MFSVATHDAILTVFFSIYKVGLAEGYNKKRILMATPTTIPYSTPIAKHRRKVAKVGIRSFLLDFHIGLTTSNSIMKITAHIITAAREAFGMNAKYGVRKLRARITKIPKRG